MNRKTAIKRLFWLGTGGVLIYSGYRGYKLYQNPALSKLDRYEKLLNSLAGVIIPATDTPGASEAGVGSFIVRMVKDCTVRASQNRFIEGIQDLSAYTSRHYDKAFDLCTPEEQVSVLKYFEKKSAPYRGFIGKVEKKLTGESFFATLKKYTVLGYGNSKLGCLEGLSYDYIPGRYIAETTLTPGQKAWATN